MPYTDQLQPASFGGVPFGVDVGQSEFGRRIALHEYPFKDIPWAEDIGRATRKLQVRGFLISNSMVYGGGDVIEQRNRMIGAAETKGPLTLIHPTYGSLKVSCLSLSISERTDKGRYFELNFQFVETGERQFPSPASIDTSGASLTFAGLLDSASTDSFLTVAKNALAYGAQTVNEVLATANKYVLPVLPLISNATNLSHLASVLPGTFGRYFGGANVGGLSLLGNTGNLLYESTVSVASLTRDATAARALVDRSISTMLGLADGGDANAFAGSVQDLTENVRFACADPADALQILKRLAVTPPDQNNTDDSSPVSAAVADIQLACNDLYRRAACASLARASSTYRPSSYNDALDKRDLVRDVIDAEILIAGDQHEDECYQALRELRRGVIDDLTTRGATLAEMKTFVEPSNLPALYIANQLYRDAERTDELVVQVNPIHPAFMPTQFRALAF